MKRWPTRTLGELGSLKGGGTPSRKVPKYFQGEIPWITGADVTDFYVQKAREFITPEAIENSATTLLPKNTVLVVSRTGVGKIGIAATALCASQDLTGIICRGSVLPEYLARCLIARADFLTSAAQGATIRGITREFLSQVEIPVPPLPEQERIVKLLDEADALRTLRAQADHRTAHLIPALFHKMFGEQARSWRNSTLGELIEDFRYGTSNKSASEGKPTLRIPNVMNQTINLHDLKFVPVSDADFERLRLVDGDLLFVRTNGNADNVGRCAVFEREAIKAAGHNADDFVYASYLIRARLQTERLLPLFVQSFLASPEGRRELRLRSKTSAGQFNINTEGLGTIPIPVPPFALQKEFAERVTEIRELEASQATSRTRLDALFQSMLHRAFNGEL